MQIPGKLERVGSVIITATISKGSKGPTTPPTEAMIKLDDQQWQKIKLPFQADLICKSHRVELKVPYYTIASNNGREHLIVTASPDKTSRATFTLRPDKVKYLITTNAPKARVYRNDKWVGYSGKTFLLEPYMEHTIKLKSKGFKPYSLNIKIMNPANFKQPKITMIEAEMPQIGKTWLVQELGLKMLPIKSGSFTMGSEHSDDDSDQRPARKVQLSRNFWMGQTEVTQKQFKILMGYNPSKFTDSGLDAPVEQVSWGQAVEFCSKLTELEIENGKLEKGDYYRLPTEAEWEYCCRAGTATFFHTGMNLTSDQANVDGRWSYDGKSQGVFRNKTTKVATFKPNAWGLYDMHGNVKEWTRDIYSSNYSSSKSQNPMGAPVGFEKVVRGGSWYDYAKNSKSTFRDNRRPSPGSPKIGFRVVLVISN